MQRLIRDLNTLYRATPALHVNDTRPGVQWLESNDADNSVFAYVRRGGDGDPAVVVVLNMTPVERPGYRIGFPGRRPLARSAEHRRGDLRRRQSRQSGRDRYGSGALDEPGPIGGGHSAAAELRDLHAGLILRKGGQG
jgi:1,4-alpha-glucan branching enzyme